MLITSYNLSKFSRKYKWRSRVTIVKSCTFVVVVVELRLESSWLLNEIIIRERVEEHVMAASFASR